jgi:chorismate-pyruvate lyase
VIAAPPLAALHPLPALYASAGRVLPEFHVVEARALPRAAHRLLVHSGDMTSKLEEHFDDTMSLRVLQRAHTAEHYRREVLLVGEKSRLPVEYGAIEITLAAFPEPLRAEILEGKLPLGALLNRHAIRYRSFAPDAQLAALFELQNATPLYGRSNVLLGASGETLAQIVEILRPV